MAHRGHRTASIVIGFLFFFSFATVSAAQLVGGAIQGTVRDSQGAVLPASAPLPIVGFA